MRRTVAEQGGSLWKGGRDTENWKEARIYFHLCQNRSSGCLVRCARENPCVYMSRLICRSVAKLPAVVVWTAKTTLEQSQKWLILTASKTTLAGNRKRKQQFLSTIAKKNSSTIAKTIISVLKIHARNIFSDLTLFSYIIAQLHPLIVRI